MGNRTMKEASVERVQQRTQPKKQFVNLCLKIRIWLYSLKKFGIECLLIRKQPFLESSNTLRLDCTPRRKSWLWPPVVVKRLLRCVKVVARCRTSPAQLMLPVFTGDRILVSLVLDAFTFTTDHGSLLLQHLELLTHLGNLLAQRNDAFGKM